MIEKLITEIYRSPKEEGMFLYLKKETVEKKTLEKIPESLLKRFGKPEHSMTLLLEPDKKLARTDARTVIEAITENGFYLQLPQKITGYMDDIKKQNNKIF